MVIALLVLWLFNAFDAVATTYAVQHHYAYEMNPLMAYALDYGAWAFVAAKVLLISAASAMVLAVWKKSERHVAVLWTVRGLAGLYVLLGGWHVVVYIYGRSL